MNFLGKANGSINELKRAFSDEICGQCRGGRGAAAAPPHTHLWTEHFLPHLEQNLHLSFNGKISAKRERGKSSNRIMTFSCLKCSRGCFLPLAVVLRLGTPGQTQSTAFEVVAFQKGGCMSWGGGGAVLTVSKGRLCSNVQTIHTAFEILVAQLTPGSKSF